MADKERLPTYDYTVRLKSSMPDGGDRTHKVEVRAAYCAPEDTGFLVFKNEDHKTVYLAATDSVLDVHCKR